MRKMKMEGRAGVRSGAEGRKKKVPGRVWE